jgi:hypothetical protein
VLVDMEQTLGVGTKLFEEVRQLEPGVIHRIWLLLTRDLERTFLPRPLQEMLHTLQDEGCALLFSRERVGVGSGG